METQSKKEQWLTVGLMCSVHKTKSTDKDTVFTKSWSEFVYIIEYRLNVFEIQFII